MASFAFLTGCEDEVPFPANDDGETVFQVEGQLDNDALVLEAGKEDVYMYADYQLNNQDILQFSGTFQKNNLCENGCDEKLKIIINNHRGGLDFVLDSALYIGNYSLSPSILTSNEQYEVGFTPIVNSASPVTYHWDLGNTTSSLSHPNIIYTGSNNQRVSLTVSSSNGETATYTDSINLENPTTSCIFDFDYSLNITPSQVYNYTFWVIDSLSPNAIFNWSVIFFNGSVLIQSTQNTMQFSTTQNINNFFICVTKESDDCNTQYCKRFSNSTTTNFSLSFVYDIQNVISIGDTSFFSMVIIEYTTPDGVFYSSELGSQGGSTFEILNIADHDNNERGQATKKIEAAVDCKLYDANGNSINFTTNQLIFAVSIPN
jgi:PKD repeat protein